MLYGAGYWGPPAVSMPFSPMPGFVSVFAYKANGIMGNALATAGPAQVFNSPTNNKSNNVTRVSGDLSYQPIWGGSVWDPDYVDTAPPTTGGFF